MNNLVNNVRIRSLSGDTTGTAAATSEAPGVVDMSGYDSCLFIGISASTGFDGVFDMFIEEAASTAGGATGFISLEAGGAVAGAAAAASTSRTYVAIDVTKPNDRYLGVGFTSGTIGDLELVIAIQYNPIGKPVAISTGDKVYDPFVSGGAVAVATPST